MSVTPVARASRFVPVAAVLCGVVIAAGGCSGDGGDAERSSATVVDPVGQSPTETPSVPDNASADVVLASAKKAAATADSVHFSGSVTDKKQKTEVSFTVTTDGTADGWMIVEGAKLKLRRVGKKFYIKGDKAFYETQGGAEFANIIDGRWMKVSSGGSGFESVESLTSIEELMNQLVPTTSGFERFAGKVVGGEPTIGLREKGTTDALYVAATGKPYPLLISAKDTGEISFSEWDKAVKIKAPAKSDVFDVSSMG
jgi:hypothetical protein